MYKTQEGGGRVKACHMEIRKKSFNKRLSRKKTGKSRVRGRNFWNRL